MNEEMRKALAELMSKGSDEIEKQITIAIAAGVNYAAILAQHGRTPAGREWWRPTGIIVHSAGMAARAAQATGWTQGAILAAIVYGMVDNFGFSGSLKMILSVAKQITSKAKTESKPTHCKWPENPAEPTKGESDAGIEEGRKERCAEVPQSQV